MLRLLSPGSSVTAPVTWPASMSSVLAPLPNRMSPVIEGVTAASAISLATAWEMFTL